MFAAFSENRKGPALFALALCVRSGTFGARQILSSPCQEGDIYSYRPERSSLNVKRKLNSPVELVPSNSWRTWPPHGAGLLRISKDRVLVDTIIAGEPYGQLSPSEKTTLAYADKLTATPSLVSEADSGALRDLGFSDIAVLEI